MFSFLKPKKNILELGILSGMTDVHCHLLPGVDDGVRDWEEAQTVKEKTALTMNSITDEAFLSEARVAFNTIEAMVDEAEQTREEVTRIKDEVKRENSIFGKWRKLTEDIMKD